jgi:4-amino-4-deoxy-L-arabinose transferase-like glycosyltransferase
MQVLLLVKQATLLLLLLLLLLGLLVVWLVCSTHLMVIRVREQVETPNPTQALQQLHGPAAVGSDQRVVQLLLMS